MEKASKLPLTGSRFAQRIGESLGEKPVTFPDVLGEYALRILPPQEDEPGPSATVTFTGTDLATGRHIIGQFVASDEPLAETLRILSPQE